MKTDEISSRLRQTLGTDMPLPGSGRTALRHSRLMDLGRQDLSLARLAEAHWDAIAILAEAGLQPVAGAIYGVWASEKPGHSLVLESGTVSGQKQFCSGAGLIDRALVTVSIPEHRLLEIDLLQHADEVSFDYSSWKTAAFLNTQTAGVAFNRIPVAAEIGGPSWYLTRPGFWHGACGPASCWAGGAAGLLDYAARQSRRDPHTLAHLGAISASVWALRSYLEMAGREIDHNPGDAELGCTRALTLRHLVEQACTDVLRRLARAMVPMQWQWMPTRRTAIRNWICTCGNHMPSETWN